MNIEVLQRVAGVLGAELEKAVFVGGAVVSFYADDPAASEARPTFDIDLAVSVATVSELEGLRERLVAKGFKQSAEDTVVCRFRLDGILVDVMALEAVGWAPGNRWYAEGFASRVIIDLPNKERIHVLPIAYFLASKFDAHADRGGTPLLSRDLEDIVHVLDNRLDLPGSLQGMTRDVRSYLTAQLSWLMRPEQKEAVIAHLGFSVGEVRYQRLKRELGIAGILESQ